MARRIIGFKFNERDLEIRVNAGSEVLEIWVFEDGRSLFLHSVVTLETVSDGKSQGVDVIEAAMQAAKSDVEAGIVTLPAR